MFENDVFSTLFESIRSWLRQPFLILRFVLFGGGLVAIVMGAVLAMSDSSQVQAVQSCPTPETTEVIDGSKDGQKDDLITLDIGGAINKPGLYELKTGSRYADLIVMAGGLSKEVSKEFVAKELNLSKELKDQEKVYLPFNSESVSTGVVADSVADVGSISINTASAETLQNLKGIGEVTAQKIISGRPYHELKDLVINKILSEKLFESLSSQLKL